MSLRTRPTRARTALLAAGAAGVVSLFAAAPSQAAFTLDVCTGGAIAGAGASTQNAPQDSLWRTIALPSYCTPFGVSFPDTGRVAAYNDTNATGSGYGRRVMGERTGTAGVADGNNFDNLSGARSRTAPKGERFGGTDEAPTQAQANQMNQGTDAVGDEGDIRVFPVSVVPIAVLANTPDNCDVFNGGAATVDGPGALTKASLYSEPDTATERIQFPKAVLEAIFAGDTTYDTWGEVFGTNVVATGGGLTDADCRAKPIKRVVRFDSSGSTFAFKDYLSTINAGRGWKGLGNTAWPNATAQAGTPAETTLVRPATSGGSAVRDTLRDTDGAVGYVDLAAARGGSSPANPFLRATGADDKYWVKVQNGLGEFQDPQQIASSYRDGSTAAADKGARCSGVTFQNVPGGADPTAQGGGWSNVTGVNTTATGQYGICTLTYVLAFDDYADAYGNTAAEQAKARTVKDYLRAIISGPGQNANGAGSGTGLWGQDQAPLPENLREAFLTGVTAMDWCKGGCVGTQPPPQQTPPVVQPPAVIPPTVVPPPAPVPAAPSNAFSLTSNRKSGDNLLLGYSLPGAGRLSVTASGTYTEKVKKKGSKKTTSRKRTVTIGAQNLAVTRSGALSVRLAIGSSARSALKKTKSISVTVRTTFTPTGGTARTVSKKVTLRGTGR